MSLLQKVSAVIAAAAVLGASALPVIVSACPVETAKVKSCCCGPKSSPGAERPCRCPKPAGGVPGSPCVIRKDAPSAMIQAAAMLCIGHAALLFVLPAASEPGGGSLSATRPPPRSEPGWDPGNPGFLLPLRL